MTKEFKNYELRHTRRPSKQPLLSSTVSVVDAKGSLYYCYVAFSEKLVDKVGKLLPYGVSTADPAFFQVVWSPERQRWAVYARYAKDSFAVHLWDSQTNEPPPWLRFYKVK
jgi:hypothetical protein